MCHTRLMLWCRRERRGWESCLELNVVGPECCTKECEPYSLRSGEPWPVLGVSSSVMQDGWEKEGSSH